MPQHLRDKYLETSKQNSWHDLFVDMQRTRMIENSTSLYE